MGNIKFSKGELKKQRDCLRQYLRFLPTLQLKKQQLQMEILHQGFLLKEKEDKEGAKLRGALSWAGFLPEITTEELAGWLKVKEVMVSEKNVAGINLLIFRRVEFENVSYDLFLTPLWADAALEVLKEIIGLRAEIKVIQTCIAILKEELRITTQRVNLFEKIKIPQAEEMIRRIRIYLGDQMANAVGRSKIAKRKMEEVALIGVGG